MNATLSYLLHPKEVVEIDITQMAIKLSLQFYEDPSYGWGYYLKIVYSKLTFGKFKIRFINSTIIGDLVGPLISEIKLILPYLFKNIGLFFNNKIDNYMK